ncbi:hypothetical protein BD769DRAFT_1681199 [Suillus cothurnatus]|nr:hypothetical protein BD769DRAFT_1681199 [Suillus cothurnatus]
MADQLNITAERPSMLAFGFSPHQESQGQDSMGQGWQSGGQGGQPSYDNIYASGPSRDQLMQYDASGSSNT